MAKKQMSAFEKALTDAALSRYEKELAGCPEELVPSAAFRQSVDALTKKAERRSWKYVNTAKKRLLVALIALLVLAATACAAIPALREGLIKLFVHDSGIAYSFEFSEEDLARAPEEIETYYAPTYVPEGYHFLKETTIPVASHILYQNDSNWVLSYNQYAISEVVPTDYERDDIISGLTVNSEGTTNETVVVDGYEVVVITMENVDGSEGMNYIWTDKQYCYLLDGTELSLTEFEKILKSIEPR